MPELVATTDGPEATAKSAHIRNDLFLAFIAPAGTAIDTIQGELKDVLNTVGYDLIELKLSDRLIPWKHITVKDDYEIIKQSMDAGDSLRKEYGKSDKSTFGGKHAVALLGLKQVRNSRAQQNNGRGNAFIFRSLKTPEEVWALRELYGRAFYAISVYSSRDKRAKRYISRFGSRTNKESDATYLITRDETDADNPYGQNIRDTFPLGDVFVDIDNIGLAKKEIDRFVQLLFGNTFKTPTRAEYCMFHAQGAAYRSADLGRQVGAVISSPDGEILAVGTNEVPKYGGGQYWAEDERDPDPRDFVREYDWNDEKKRELLKDLLDRLTKLETKALPMSSEEIDALLNDIFSSKADRPLKNALVMDIIGFYRSVHAETAAIIDAARRGVSVKGCTMYVTAYPCHECARHILASGVRLVRYIEPYPKSLAEDQYPDSIEVGSGGTPGDKLLFEPFVGVAPWQYIHLFVKNKRKEKDGGVFKWRAESCKLRYGRTLDFFEKVEHNWSESVENLIEAGGNS